VGAIWRRRGARLLQPLHRLVRAWSNGSGVANANWYNARTGVSGSTNQNWNAYSRWGSSTFSGPNQTVNTQSRSNAQGSVGSFQSSSGAEGAGYNNKVTGNRGGAVKTSNGDVYAGRDGNVYQHTDNGWSKWNDGGWQPVNPPKSSSNSTPPGASNRQQSQPPANSARTGTANSANRPQSGSSASRSGNVDSSSWNQLQHDQMGRQFGQGQFGQGRSAENRFEGGRSEGRFSGGGGGRFRR
jgi:hypothetical protein